VQERLREIHALLVALREIADRAQRDVVERKARERAVHCVAQRRAGESAHAAGEAQEAAHAQLRIEPRRLGDEADAFVHGAGVRDRVEAVDRDAAARRHQVPGEQSDEGGLAGAVRAEQAERLARLDAQVDAGEGGAVAEAPRQRRRFDRRAVRSRSLTVAPAREVAGPRLATQRGSRITTPGTRSPASAKAIAMRWSS
jgi:hypothetical protein